MLTERQLAERAQVAGVTLNPVVEVEDLEAAVQLVARGVGDTVLARARSSRDATPPSPPATRAFVDIVERRLERLGEPILYRSATSAGDG